MLAGVQNTGCAGPKKKRVHPPYEEDPMAYKKVIEMNSKLKHLNSSKSVFSVTLKVLPNTKRENSV
jgi:hypothetical protein